MKQTRRGQPKNQYNPTILLLGLVLVLAVVLVIVLCIAFGSNGEIPSGTTNGTTITPGTSTTTSPGETTTPKELEIFDLQGDTQISLAPSYTFSGTSDPALSLTVNGEAVQRESDGSFTLEVSLQHGVNEFVFAYNGQTTTVSVDYRILMQSFYPETAETFNSGATIHFEVMARAGSTVSVSFNGTTVEMKKSSNQAGTGVLDGFECYTGQYTLTDTNTSDLNLGSVTYTVTCDGLTETYTSGEITCLKAPELSGWDENATPSGGKYINVGSGYICEIITYSAETFDGRTEDDFSRPTNNYLPEGTVDYCSTQLLVKGKLKYAILRSGHRVYFDKKNTPASGRLPVIDRYKGTLPDHNEIGFASFTAEGNHLVLTLDCLWKAPFYFDLLPQEYYYPNGGSDRNYSVTACTAEYIDITFCYATVFTGTVELPANNPLFRSAEIIKNESDHTLRLYLKKKGGFYGWDSRYNEKGQLCFLFLKPGRAVAADNAYGVDLSGLTIMLDVGHGGKDGGAVGKHDNLYAEEADCNLALAFAVKKELESMGATVVMNRTTDVQITTDERIMMLKQVAPDLCICIHQNAIGGYPNINGLEVYYYTPYAKRIAELIQKENQKDSVYKSAELNWHIYFVARETVCPVVLMENGYVSSPYDAMHMLDPVSIETKAKAMARGIAAYYLELNS